MGRTLNEIISELPRARQQRIEKSYRELKEAVGGELELIVKLPRHPALRLRKIGEALERPSPSPGRNAPPRRRRTASS